MSLTNERWLRDGATVYQPMHDGWRDGVEQFRNRFWLDAHSDKESGITDEDIARRIAACVNACTGIPTLILEGGAETALHHTKKAMTERDELLASLKEALHEAKSSIATNSPIVRAIELMETAIAKTEAA